MSFRNAREGVQGGSKRPSCPSLRVARGQECPFIGAIYFFNNVQFDHSNLHWSYPKM